MRRYSVSMDVGPGEQRYKQALEDAIELAEEGWGYATPYFQEKWESEERIARLKDTLEEETLLHNGGGGPTQSVSVVPAFSQDNQKGLREALQGFLDAWLSCDRKLTEADWEGMDEAERKARVALQEKGEDRG